MNFKLASQHDLTAVPPHGKSSAYDFYVLSGAGDEGPELLERWRELDPAATLPFREMAAMDAERYDVEWRAYAEKRDFLAFVDKVLPTLGMPVLENMLDILHGPYQKVLFGLTLLQSCECSGEVQTRDVVFAQGKNCGHAAVLEAYSAARALLDSPLDAEIVLKATKHLVVSRLALQNAAVTGKLTRKTVRPAIVARLDLGENGDTLLRTTYKDAIKDGIRQGARLERRIRGGAIERRICHVCRRQASLDDEPFPLCGGCSARRYCSVRCQRHDWVHGHDRNVPSRPVPHSSNCPCAVPAAAAPEAGVSKSRRSKKKMRRGKKSRK